MGESVAQFGVTGTLNNARLRIFNSSNRLVTENDNWLADDLTRVAVARISTRVGAFERNSGLDAALVVTLAPGAYTAQVSGVNDETGVGLVEIYEVP